ncbi:META domain-containing protein [Promineifilum sp.]|uniref:META domain-containing protein n=1 Tax=Promineifilum sp. TaxID=2664178 RepID=UPI0035B30012
MKANYAWMLVILTVLAVTIVACSPAGGQEPIAAEPTTESQGETKTLFVGPEQVECTGVGPQLCLQVREDPNAEYLLFYNTIAGFTFEPGYEYELLVRVDPVANPPADGSSLAYTLIEVVSQTAVSGTEESITTEESGVQGVRWVLVSYLNAAGETVDALADREATLEFRADGQLGGNASCNQFFAGYTIDGDALTVTQAGSTMMACEPAEIMDQEAQYLNNLQAAATFAATAEQLTIANANGDVVLTFRASQPASLTGTNWTVTSFNTGTEAVTSLLADTTMTATFTEDGQLNGSAGCNNFMTSYTVDGDAITIQPAATTRKMCNEPAGIMEQETQFVNALATAATYHISGNSLELRTADGALAVSFVAE